MCVLCAAGNRAGLPQEGGFTCKGEAERKSTVLRRGKGRGLALPLSGYPHVF